MEYMTASTNHSIVYPRRGLDLTSSSLLGKLFDFIAPKYTGVSEIDQSTIMKISARNRVLYFRHPFAIPFEFVNDRYAINIYDLEIFISEKTRPLAIKAFEDELAFIWENYVENEDELSEGALLLKQRLMSLLYV